MSAENYVESLVGVLVAAATLWMLYRWARGAS